MLNDIITTSWNIIFLFLFLNQLLPQKTENSLRNTYIEDKKCYKNILPSTPYLYAMLIDK